MSQRTVPSSITYRRASAWAALCIAASAPAQGADVSASGFATLGYARSDQPYGYQRFIDDGGTLRRDSVAGVQLDARLGGGFGATAQVKAAASSSSDNRYQASLAWAFVSYRPSNDWLFRFGKQRIPLYLYSETVDVGATYDFARLPTEMYSIAPSNDAVGASFSKVWNTGGGEFTFDGYWGESHTDFRLYFRDGIPPNQMSGPLFTSVKLRGVGAVLTYRKSDFAVRMGLLRGKAKRGSGQTFNASFPFVEIAPGIGYFQVDSALPGPGAPQLAAVISTVVTLGADLTLPGNVRLVGEFARSLANDEIGPQGKRGYVSALHRTGAWTPYLTYSFLRSPLWQQALYGRINETALPPFVPFSAQINASQRAGADQMLVFDQSSWALGTSYAISAGSKVKAEFARTRIGDVSSLVDPLPGTTVRNATINVWSLSYSVVF